MYSMYPTLEGQHVFITGGGSGIGASIVEAFANVGSIVTFVDIDSDASTALASQFDNVTFEYSDIRNIENKIFIYTKCKSRKSSRSFHRQSA